MKKYFSIIVLIGIVIVSLTWYRNVFLRRAAAARYLVTASANPGTITLYARTGTDFTLKKTIDTGFQIVHTVRLGDIYNNGKTYIIAGVSNSFYREPYGCSIVSYDLVTFQKQVIDQVGDLRCKDLTIGDADNDGKNDILLGTHGKGIVNLYSWSGDSWKTTTLETNFIAQVDKEKGTSHLVPNTDVPCKTCIIQTAVHIVKIGDIDNDGENEVVTTMSSPLELTNQEEISFVRVYRKSGDTWSGQTVDSLTGREFRSITINDVYGNGTNTLVIGIGSPRNEPGSIIAYDFLDGTWKKTTLHNDATELNMKGVAIGPLGGKVRTILLATGFPNANIMTFRWNDEAFIPTTIGSIRRLIDMPDAQFNSMAAAIMPETTNAFIVGGSTVFPKQKIGWEATDKGFLVRYDLQKNSWLPTILSSQNILGFDMM